MEFNKIRYELQNLISGKSGTSYDALIQAIANYLRSGTRASPMAEEKHKNKPQEENRLIQFIDEHNLWFSDIEEKDYVSSGAEQKVYIKDSRHVYKLNDGIYYASWEDYFNNLLLHNYFFSDTAYHLIGFYKTEDKILAVVEQNFIIADTITDLTTVQSFLKSNGFVNTRRHDYHNPDLGIIIEDLHDENVLTNQQMLYFIDTVFYIKPDEFWKD